MLLHESDRLIGQDAVPDTWSLASLHGTKFAASDNHAFLLHATCSLREAAACTRTRHKCVVVPQTERPIATCLFTTTSFGWKGSN
jgi:hypothetical protein